jgi:hypothetical protein
MDPEIQRTAIGVRHGVRRVDPHAQARPQGFIGDIFGGIGGTIGKWFEGIFDWVSGGVFGSLDEILDQLGLTTWTMFLLGTAITFIPGVLIQQTTTDQAATLTESAGEAVAKVR